MRTRKRILPRSRWLSSYGVAAFLALISNACYSYLQFRPISDERPITMFGRYKVDIEGIADMAHALHCNLDFITPSFDTSNIDTIPLFLVDSLCFEGACLEHSFCRRLQGRFLSDTEFRSGWSGPPRRELGHDLVLCWMGLFPVGYVLRDTLGMPPSCRDRDISVWIHARLIDRVTGQVVAQESKRVQFEIKKKHGIDIGS